MGRQDVMHTCSATPCTCGAREGGGAALPSPSPRPAVVAPLSASTHTTVAGFLDSAATWLLGDYPVISPVWSQ